MSRPVKWGLGILALLLWSVMAFGAGATVQERHSTVTAMSAGYVAGVEACERRHATR